MNYALILPLSSQFSIKSLLSLRLLPLGEAGRGLISSPFGEVVRGSCSFLLTAEETEPKKTATPSPYIGDVTAPNRRSFTKVSSDHQRSGLIFCRLAHESAYEDIREGMLLRGADKSYLHPSASTLTI